MAKVTNKEFGSKVRELRKNNNYSLRNVEILTGLSHSYLSKVENGRINIPKQETLAKLAKGLHVSDIELYRMAGMLDNDEVGFVSNESNNTVNIPVLGTIACGEPITADQNIESYIPMAKDTLPSGSNFCLHCKGDSMEPKIANGSLVVIHEQPTVEDGEIAAVLIDGEATLKKVHHVGKQVLLMAINDKYEPIVLDGKRDSRILGKAIQVITQL